MTRKIYVVCEELTDDCRGYCFETPVKAFDNIEAASLYATNVGLSIIEEINLEIAA